MVQWYVFVGVFRVWLVLWYVFSVFLQVLAGLVVCFCVCLFVGVFFFFWGGGGSGLLVFFFSPRPLWCPPSVKWSGSLSTWKCTIPSPRGE